MKDLMRKNNQQELSLSAYGCWRGLFMILLALIQTMQVFPPMFISVAFKHIRHYLDKY